MKYAKYEKLEKKKDNDKKRAELYLNANSVHEYLVSREINGICDYWFDKYVVYWLCKEHGIKVDIAILSIASIVELAIIGVALVTGFNIIVSTTILLCICALGLKILLYAIYDTVKTKRLAELGINSKIFIKTDDLPYATFGNLDDAMSYCNKGASKQ